MCAMWRMRICNVWRQSNKLKTKISAYLKALLHRAKLDEVEFLDCMSHTGRCVRVQLGDVYLGLHIASRLGV